MPSWPILPDLKGSRFVVVVETQARPHVARSLSVFTVTVFLVFVVVAGVFVTNGITCVILGFS